MKLNTKLNEYKNNIETLRAIESLKFIDGLFR